MRKIHNLEWWPRVIVVRSAMAEKTITRMAMETIMITVKVVGSAMTAKTIAVKVVGLAMSVQMIIAKIGRLATAAKIIAIHEMSSNVVCR